MRTPWIYSQYKKPSYQVYTSIESTLPPPLINFWFGVSSCSFLFRRLCNTATTLLYVARGALSLSLNLQFLSFSFTYFDFSLSLVSHKVWLHTRGSFWSHEIIKNVRFKQGRDLNSRKGPTGLHILFLHFKCTANHYNLLFCHWWCPSLFWSFIVVFAISFSFYI